MDHPTASVPLSSKQAEAVRAEAVRAEAEVSCTVTTQLVRQRRHAESDQWAVSE